MPFRTLFPLAVCALACSFSGAFGEEETENAIDREPDGRRTVPAKTPGVFEIQDGDLFVFLGDSITHQCLYTQFIEDFFYTRYPGKRIRFRNAGISGEMVGDALDRFDADVGAFSPKVVSVLFGMNDASYRPFREEEFKAYERGMNALFDKISGAGAQAITFGPTLFDARQSVAKPPDWVAPTAEDKAALKAYYNATLAYYGAWLEGRSAELGVRHVDLAGPMGRLTADVRSAEPSFTMVPDAVHPDACGHAVVAFSILEALGVSGTVTAIRAAPGLEAGEWQVKAEGGEVGEIEATADGFRFSFLAGALPWVLPEQARRGYALTKSGHKLSNERLTVSGLAAGRYELLIDGNAVGTFSHDRLAAKVELQENEETPQYQRALAVALANLKRNEIGVKPLRDLWARYRQGGIEASAFSKATGDLERVIAIYDEKIFAIRQPEKQIYEIRRVSGAGGRR